MRQRGYAIAFALVLVAVIAGAFFGGRFIVQRIRQDFQFRPEWTPPAVATAVGSAASPEVTSSIQATVSTRRPGPTEVVIPTPVAPTPEPYQPTASPASTAAETPAPVLGEIHETALPEESATPLPAPAPGELFAAEGPVRASLGDCGGTYVRGLVADRQRNPLPGVRLRLVDEFGNEAIAVTKSGQADLGRYDFPVAGPPRRFSISVVDQGGASLSRPVGFAYDGDAADAQATCYWIDWQRR